MAYSNSPENSTYKTVNLEFTATSWPRTSTSVGLQGRDPLITNMYFDRNSNENQTRDFVLVKRPGLSDTSDFTLQKAASTDIVNGTFQDPNTSYIYWSVNNKIYRYNGSTTTTLATMGGTAPTGTNSVGFCLFLTSTGTRYLMINNGTQLWYHDVSTNTATQVTDVDLPSPMIPHMVFLDGYLFVIKKNTGDIYNSDLDDPTSWTAGNYITAEINPDFAIYLTKVKNYIVCFGNEGIEFFYDAAQPSGSPLGRNESYYLNVILQSSVCNVNDVLYFVGRSRTGGPRAYRLEGNNLEQISPSWVERDFEDIYGAYYTTSDFTKNYLFNFSVNGHFFLGFNTGLEYTYIYDLEEGFWYRWVFGSTAASNRIEGITKPTSASHANSVVFVGDRTSPSLLYTNWFNDFDITFTASYISGEFSAETFNWKTCSRVALLCDQYVDTGISNAQISWSDNDGYTYSTPRNINVLSQNPYITQTGRFRSRLWKIEYSDNYPFRMWGLSMDLNVGSI